MGRTVKNTFDARKYVRIFPVLLSKQSIIVFLTSSINLLVAYFLFLIQKLKFYKRNHQPKKK